MEVLVDIRELRNYCHVTLRVSERWSRHVTRFCTCAHQLLHVIQIQLNVPRAGQQRVVNIITGQQG